MRKKILVMLTLVGMLLSVLPLSSFAMTDPAYTYLYVATDGSDDAAGTIDAPLKSMDGARLKLREIKSSGALGKKGAVVYFREGNYPVDKGIKFSAEDSGTAEAPIVYRSYPDETATFVGGAAIDPAAFKPVTDQSILSRVIDEGARTQIYSVNLKALGFNNLGDVYLNGAYSYLWDGPLDPPPASYSIELFVDSEAMTVARYPNSSYSLVEEVVFDGYSSDGLPDGRGKGDIWSNIEIKISDERLAGWTTAPDACLFGFWWYDWADQSMFVEKVDPVKKTIVTDRASLYGTRPGQRYYIYNLLEEIDIPGEYYIDRTTGVLYIYPPKDMSKIKSISLSLLEEYLVNVENGASYIDFKDMKFTAMRKGAFYIDGQNINVINCEVELSADSPIKTEKNARDCVIKSCYVHDTNGGISLSSGIYDDLTPGNCIAENNHVERFSRINKTYKSGVAVGRVGNIARHNEIHDAPHLAISFSGNENIVEYNEVYDVIQEGDDSGAIYGGQTWCGRGLQIRYNYLHDIKSSTGHSVGRSAVYLDGAQSDVTMMGNVVYNVAGTAFWINGGQDCNVFNNIVVDVPEGAVYICNLLQQGYGYMHDGMKTRFEKYPWEDKASEPWKNEVWTERYPELLPQLYGPTEQSMLPLNNLMKNNLIVNGKGTKMLGGSELYLTMENNFVTESDPGFVSMENKNFLLNDDADAYNEITGFNFVPFTRMGRYSDRALARVKDSVVLQIGSPYARSMDKDMKIDSENISVVPYIDDNYTMVPLRFLSEAFGATVDYNKETRTITILNGSDTLELTVDSLNAKKNGEAVTLSKEAKVNSGRTLIPLRDVAELLGKQVYWFDTGLIVVSNSAELFSETSDAEIIDYLHEYLTIH
ncbi:MAG: right-handed parallel beta-helix repeat-containing protein [Clostridia bacterium]|nr:right-handed parallel beta-helix repeat-containing protein [Clostridia bacterium]